MLFTPSCGEALFMLTFSLDIAVYRCDHRLATNTHYPFRQRSPVPWLKIDSLGKPVPISSNIGPTRCIGNHGMKLHSSKREG